MIFKNLIMFLPLYIKMFQPHKAKLKIYDVNENNVNIKENQTS